jgi:hypothetical protein
MLYHWRSYALRQYGYGDILVAADSLEEARAKAIGYAFRFFGNSEPEDKETFMQNIYLDIAEEPSGVSGDMFVAFLWGSE